MNRYQELFECFREGKSGHCAITDSNTYWEGVRWTEVHRNGDSMTIGGMKVPLWTEFLVCREHEPVTSDAVE